MLYAVVGPTAGTNEDDTLTVLNDMSDLRGEMASLYSSLDLICAIREQVMTREKVVEGDFQRFLP